MLEVSFVPQPHKVSHQNDGTDEIVVAGLSGLLADDQHVLDVEVESVITTELVDGQSIDVAIDTLITAHIVAADPHTGYFLLAGETTDAKLYSGANLIIYSDAGSTEKARIEGATGNLTTTGTITSDKITILGATPILVFQDSNSLGAASVGYIEWRDSAGVGRAGFFGNNTADNDDLKWMNEQNGNIVIETTGAGTIELVGDTNVTGDITAKSVGINTPPEVPCHVKTETGLTEPEWADGVDVAVFSSASVSIVQIVSSVASWINASTPTTRSTHSIQFHQGTGSTRFRLAGDTIKMTLDSIGLDVVDHIIAGEGMTTGTIGATTISILVAGDIVHFDDYDTLISFTSDNIKFTVGGTQILELDKGSGGAIDSFNIFNKAKITDIGGYAVKLTNETGALSVAGDVVQASTVTVDAVDLAGDSSIAPVGVFLQSNIPDGSEAWIVQGGIADVHMDAGGCGLGDRIVTSATPGRGDVNNNPGAVIAHFQEIGHAFQIAGANGTARCMLHFL